MSRESLRSTASLMAAAAAVCLSFSACIASPAQSFAFRPAGVRIVTGSITIPDGTPVHLSLLKELKSGGNKAGEEVPFEVSRDVYSTSHTLLIAADTPAFGKILQSNRRGMFGQSGKLKFSIDYIVGPNKSHIFLRSNAQLVRGGDNRGAAIATAVLFSVLGAFINGKDVTVPKGQDFLMYVDNANAAPPTLPDSVPVESIAPPAEAHAPATAAAPQSLFTFANGAQTVGTLLGFDGSVYTVSTPKGMRQFKKAAIVSIRAL